MTTRQLERPTATSPDVGDRASAASADGFRPDIDGLRAVAILVIVLYHAGVPGFDGGFVGVDVFFAISGYLITRNLLHERHGTGRIGLWAFWGRRLRRLAPALALVTLATLAGSLVVLAPIEWRSAVVAGATSTLYVSNLHFAQEATDYFADGATSPFLHTWSLSVEEQFYVVWPLLVAGVLAVATRGRRASRGSLTAVLGLLVVGSFALNVVLTERGTPWAFFSLPTRAWQFAAAGLLAAWTTGRHQRAALRAAAGWAGLAMVAAAVVSFDELTSYPGVAASVPTLGTLLLLGSGGVATRPVLDRVLGAAPVQVIGRVSYSWYLWHWPVIVLAVAAMEDDSLGVTLTAAVAALVLGMASYRFLERPVRFHPRLRASPRASIAAGVAFAAVALGAAGLAVLAYRHQIRRPFDAALAEAHADRDYTRPCAHHPELPGTCLLGAGATSPEVMVIGDSHAMHWIPAFARVAERSRTPIAVRERGGCPGPDVPIAKHGTREDSQGCADFRAETERQLAELDPEVVVLVNSSYLGRILTAPGTVGSRQAQVERWEAALRDQIGEARDAGARVAMIEIGPQLEDDPITCIGRSRSLRHCTPSRYEALRRSAPIRAAERRVVDQLGGIPRLDVADILCTRKECRLQIDGTYTMTDDDHLTATFTSSQASRIEDLLEETEP